MPNIPDDHPGADYPGECRGLMEQTMERVAAGDITGAMRLQKKANDCLRRHGHVAHDMPEEYYRLMHQSIAAARRGDMAEAERIGGRMEQVIALTDFPGVPGMPEECKDLLRRSNEAEDRGDTRQNIVLTKQYNQCLRAHGLLEVDMPDEFFDLQLTALGAQERGDMAAYQRALAEVQLLMQAHGMEDGNGGKPGPSA
jgi:predicted protein tyrosine phosphatase